MKNPNFLFKPYGIALVLTLAIGVLMVSCQTKNEAQNDAYVVMLSMDGFRWDYADRVPTPWLDQLAQEGVTVSYVIPAFPSKTFPNHYSMATGLYPDNHGIVNNNFYCPDLDLTYRLGDRESVENGAFSSGEPIWVTAEKQGIRTASYFWVGSEAPVQGIQPSYWKLYEQGVPFKDRIDTVLYWLNLPLETRPRLITLYFHEPDSRGHRWGPDSEETNHMVMQLDSLVGLLITRLGELPIAGNINLIVTSDHGMTQTSPDRYVNLEDYVSRDWFEKVHGGNPLFSFRAIPGMLDSAYHQLKKADKLFVWKAAEIPERFNYGKNPRILDMVVLADSTWSVGWGEPRGSYLSGGSHGWDNMQKDMHTIFYAKGPAFKQSYRGEPIEVVDLYPLIAHILKLEPATVDGRLDRVMPLLKRRKQEK